MAQISHFAPAGGWMEQAYYVVEVSFDKGNPLHKAIFYTGFLNSKNGGPGGYSGLFNPGYDPPFMPLDEIYFMNVVYRIGGMQE